MAVTPDIERPIIADVKSVRSVVSTCREGPLLKVNTFVTRRAPRPTQRVHAHPYLQLQGKKKRRVHICIHTHIHTYIYFYLLVVRFLMDL